MPVSCPTLLNIDKVQGLEVLGVSPIYKLFRVTTPEAAIFLIQEDIWFLQNAKTCQILLEEGPIYIIYKNEKPYLAYNLDYNTMEVDCSRFLANPSRMEIQSILKHFGLLDTKAKINFCPGNLGPDDFVSIYQNAQYSYLYAFRTKASFPTGEPTIASSARYSYQYALEVLFGPFPAGEPSIAKFYEFSFMYARDVLKSSFPAGEASIASSAEYSYLYAHNVLKSPFPAGESAIAKHVEYSYLYSLLVLRAPFPAGEEVIVLDPGFRIEYAKNVLHDPNPELWYQKRKMVKGNYLPWESLR